MERKIGAVIVAGGLSSRMKDFKPLLRLGNSTIIETTIDNFKKINVNNIVVVTGYRSNDIKEHLANYDVDFVHNESYETTHMFDSICLGLEKICGKVDYVFISPVDCPFVQSFTLKTMIEHMEKYNYNLSKPSYDGRGGHPLLVKNTVIKDILEYDGSNGLKGALNNLDSKCEYLEFIDPGILMDADTMEDYFKLVEYNEEKSCPSVELCYKLYDYFNVSDEVRAHSLKVTMVAVKISEHLKNKGVKLNNKKLIAASLLHDIAKGRYNHSKVGSEWLCDMGYVDIADIVRYHDRLMYVPTVITEKEVVYLADKLVKGTNLVTIEERFSEKIKEYKDDQDILNILERNRKQTVNLYEAIFNSMV